MNRNTNHRHSVAVQHNGDTCTGSACVQAGQRFKGRQIVTQEQPRVFPCG